MSSNHCMDIKCTSKTHPHPWDSHVKYASPTPPNSKDEIRKQLAHALQANYPGTTATEQFLDDCMMFIHAHDKALIAAVRPKEMKTTEAMVPLKRVQLSGYNAALADLDANSKKVLGE